MRPTDAQSARPPWIAQHLMRVCSPPGNAQAVLGDLEEEFRRRAGEVSPGAARAWYRSEVFRSGLRFGSDRAVRALGPRWVFAVLVGLAATVGLLGLSLYLGVPDLVAGKPISSQIVVGTLVILASSVAGGVMVGRMAPQNRISGGFAVGAVFMLFVRSQAGVWPHPAWAALQIAGVVAGAVLASSIVLRSRATV